MPWFQKLCRNVGLAVHHVKHPESGGEQGKLRKQTLTHTVEQEQLSDRVTLRRTVIEEVEIKPGAER